MSNHFTKASAIPAIQIPAEDPGMCNESHRTALGPHGVWQVPHHLHPMYSFSPYYPHLPAAPTMPHNAYGPGYYMPPGASPSVATPPPQGPSPSTFSSPGTTMSHDVSLSDFCTKYRLSANTQEKLVELDYTPGNKIVESLSEADWKESGLSVLASRSFLAAHRKFCEAIRSGTWN